MKCHARAIAVGDAVHLGCDTFLRSKAHTRNHDSNAVVGACKVTKCSYNDDFECMAETIKVGIEDKDVHCLTFTAT